MLKQISLNITDLEKTCKCCDIYFHSIAFFLTRTPGARGYIYLDLTFFSFDQKKTEIRL